ncbi:hypothetical protein Sango_0363000 [Sesamum angolense]|uniref:Retrovirus-related Pol polyprotein from transposon TNT 1-94 n=1 Tax=Sesamum angolense TaxID=2727404 RepID=A0AAE1X9P2_9LAMI|nr:hypothetical protein Sango_0363000 [Sesamum angolense]
MSDINLNKWLEAIKFEMDSMGSNKIWTLIDPSKGVKLGGCKWVYKCKFGDNVEVTVFKARLVMDMKMPFLNRYVEEEIYMDQPKGFTSVVAEQKCTRPNVGYALSMTSRYQACVGEAHWSVVKIILKCLRRTKDMFLIYGSGELILEGYSDASFQSDDDNAKSQSGFVFKLNGGVDSRPKSSHENHLVSSVMDSC